MAVLHTVRRARQNASNGSRCPRTAVAWSAIAVSLLMLAVQLMSVPSAQAAERKDVEPAAPGAAKARETAKDSAAAKSNSAIKSGPLAPAVRSKNDSETQLVERRSARLKELSPPPTPPTIDGPTNNPIDQFIVASWSGLPASQRPTELCDDATFARRVYLDLVGAIPPLTELNKFLLDPAANKRSKLIDQLLGRKAEYAAHWTPFWEDALASQTVGSQGGIPTRGNYRDWIFRSFVDNKPFDVMVAELLDPTMPGRKAATTEEVFGTKYRIEFVRNEDDTATLQTASAVGQVFLSTAMKCASCHDHFDNPEWTQERFLGFAGLFARQDLEKIRCDVHSGRFIPARFPFAVANTSEDAPHDLKGRLHFAAQLVTDPANSLFARSIVNRLWRRYLGLGLFEPIDDYRPERPASHPELLDWLAYDFVEHGCDLKHTIRLILNSRTYQLPYDSKLADRHSATNEAAPRYVRSPALRRLSAEQVLDSVRVATTGQMPTAERAYLDSRITALAQALGKPASRNEISTARSEDVAVVQALELLNGPEINDLISEAAAVAKPIPKQDLKRLVDKVYRTVLSRPASTEEKRLGQALFSSTPATVEAVKDMYWALLVSPEFQFIK